MTDHKFGAEQKGSYFYVRYGEFDIGLETIGRIMDMSEDEAKEFVLSKGIFNATSREIFCENPNSLHEMLKEVVKANNRKLEAIESMLKDEIDKDRNFAWTLYVSLCAADMRKWAQKARPHLPKDYGWEKGYPSAPFDRFVIKTIEQFKPELHNLICKTAISGKEINELLKKHLH